MKEKLKYGKLVESVSSTRTIKTSKGDRSFTTRFVWDNLGRMKKLFYPDGEVLVYGYNSGGLLQNASGWYKGIENVYVRDIQYDEFGNKTKMVLGNNVKTKYEYNRKNRRLKNMKTTGADGKVFQNIKYEFDYVGNIKKRTNKGFKTEDNVERNSLQTYEYDSLHRLTGSGGSYDFESWMPIFDKRINSYDSSFKYDSIGNIMDKTKDNTGLFPGTGETVTIEKTTYSNAYSYESTRPHAVTSAGPKKFSYDMNGNMTDVHNSMTGFGRKLSRDDENRLTATDNSLYETSSDNYTTYRYDSSGNRVVKNGKFGEVVYVNSCFTVRNDSVVGKHVFAGKIRIASKMHMTDAKDGEHLEIDKGVYYYHGDHLGSSSVITNQVGQFHEHIEYFPYGETWITEKVSENVERLRYKFSGKEEDPETGLYYYGARYYDPVLSRWTGIDPMLNGYLGGKAGMGGVYRSGNLDLYSYAVNNPVKYTDPDGRKVFVAGSMSFKKRARSALQTLDPSARVNFITGKVSNGWMLRKNNKPKGSELVKSLVGSDKGVVIAEWGFKVKNLGPYEKNCAVPINQIGSKKRKIGSGTLIWWNPDSKNMLREYTETNGKNEVTSKASKDFIVLGHELIHALHNKNGTREVNMSALYMGLDNEGYSAIGEEIRTVGNFKTPFVIPTIMRKTDTVTENDLRKENGLNLRNNY